MFGFDSTMQIMAFVIQILVFVMSLSIHEYSHARMAVALGDLTPKYLGRLTLNPIPHIDLIGLLTLVVARIGWAKPVPVNPNNFSSYRKGMFLVALAGPFSNFILAFLASLAYVLLYKMNFLTSGWEMVLRTFYNCNILLAVFNILPVPPLDGSKILASVFPQLEEMIFGRLGQYGSFLLILLAVTGVIGAILAPMYKAVSFIIQMSIHIIT